MSDLITMMSAAAGAGGEETDPNFNQTVLLLHGDGTNGAQNNTFLDSSTNNFTITRNGNTTQGTFSPFSLPNGQFSNFFDGTGDYLAFANGTFNLGNNDFVVEAFVYLPAAISGVARSIAAGNTDAATAAGSSWDMSINTSQKFTCTVWISSANKTITSTASVPNNEWVHLAFVRTGGTISMFINGTKDGTNTTLSTDSVQNGSTTYPPHIGRNGASADFPGYISNCRLIIGANASNVYNATGSSITVPTAPLTAVTNTTVVTCQSNRFVDNSSSPKTITVNGNPSVQPFSPFLPSAAYDPSVNGGSGYFDGSGDSLRAVSGSAASFGTGDFTIEAWIYPTVAAESAIWAMVYNIALWMNSNYTIYASTPGDPGWSALTSTGTVKPNSWNHVALTRSSGTAKIWINGVEEASGSRTLDLTYTAIQGTVGGYSSGGDPSNLFTGYISNLRIVKGTAVYTSAFTPPTAPLSAITNTQFLTLFTNAGIFDNTGKNNLETVGNAQIDTSVKKYGTGSMEFDGTTDYVVQPTSYNYGYGTGDFTIEFWLYLNSTSVQTIVSNLTSASSVNPHIYYNGGVKLYTNNADRISGSPLSTSQWYHIAICRASGSTKLFVNGTQDGSTYSDTNDYGSTAPLAIGTYWASGSPITSDTLNGYIDDLRITKGVARYTTTFTPPTAAFPDL